MSSCDEIATFAMQRKSLDATGATGSSLRHLQHPHAARARVLSPHRTLFDLSLAPWQTGPLQQMLPASRNLVAPIAKGQAPYTPLSHQPWPAPAPAAAPPRSRPSPPIAPGPVARRG